MSNIPFILWIFQTFSTLKMMSVMKAANVMRKLKITALFLGGILKCFRLCFHKGQKLPNPYKPFCEERAYSTRTSFQMYQFSKPSYTAEDEFVGEKENNTIVDFFLFLKSQKLQSDMVVRVGYFLHLSFWVFFYYIFYVIQDKGKETDV